MIFLADSTGRFTEEISASHEIYSFGMPTVKNPAVNLFGFRVPDIRYSIANYFRIAKARKRITKTLQSAAPDIVLGNGVRTAAMMGKICRGLEIPLVVCVHGIGNRSNDLFSMRKNLRTMAQLC